MAIVFELVAGFGPDAAAARAAAAVDLRGWRLPAGPHRIPLHPPFLTMAGPSAQVSVLPVGVGWGVAAERGHPRLALTAAELSELGRGLYEVLAGFTGYTVARVGWEPEGVLDDLAESWSDWAAELRDGSLHGLVLSDSRYAELDADIGLARSQAYEVFRPGYRWVPYRGERPTALPAD